MSSSAKPKDDAASGGNLGHMVTPAKINDDTACSGNGSHQEKTFSLNVGGTSFTTSRASMLRVKGSFFEAMVSGRHGYPSEMVIVSETGSGKSYFIDRDATHFRHILNFLRAGAVVSLPEDDAAREELAVEADFYGLDAMVKAIRRPMLDLLEFLPPEVVSIQEEEKALRAEFVGLDYWIKPLLPYKHLVRFLGEGRDEAYPAPLLTDVDTPLRKDKSRLFLADIWGKKGEWPKEAVPVTVTTLEEFSTNFNMEFPNVLLKLDPILRSEPVVVAGGAVLRSLTAGGNVRTGDFWNRTEWAKGKLSDIDLFVYGVSTGEANGIVRRIFQALAVGDETWGIVRSKGVVNIHNEDIKVQIVLRIYSSPTEILIGFDVDCCCCCYDGRYVWATRRCLYALKSGVNVLNPLHAWPNKASYEMRLGKYAFRGFPVAIPGIATDRVDYRNINQITLRDLRGLARFIKVSLEMDSSNYEELVYNREERRLDTIERPSFPTEIASIRREIHEEATQDEKLVRYQISGYDDLPSELLVPEVYSGNGDRPSQLEWWMWDLPTTQHSRNKAIDIIIHCKHQNPPDGIPRQMSDAWSTEKRSREYLNDEMDKIDLDTIYYSEAYIDEEEQG